MVQISKGVIIKVNGRLNYETKKKKKKPGSMLTM